MRRFSPFIVALFWVALSLDAAPATKPAARLHEVRIAHNERSLRLTLVIFNEGDFSLTIIDNATPSGHPRFKDLAAAMEANQCVAGCNGSFFNRTPFEPFGLMISEGKSFGSFDPKSWMDGLLVIRLTQASLEPSPTLVRRDGITSLLQSGPWLVRGGASIQTLDPARQAPRTFVAHDGTGNWALGTSESCSLSELALLLRNRALTDMIDVREALNFDGGPSSGLWLNTSAQKAYVREGWPVRNYIGVRPRG